MVCITVIMLTVVSFAWLISNSKNDVESFDVRVVGYATIDYRFFRYDKVSKKYVEVEAKNLETFMENEEMIPGVPVDCKIEVDNTSPSPISLKIDFTGISCTNKDGELDDNKVEQAQRIVENFTVQAAVGHIPTADENVNKFLKNGIWAGTATSFRLIDNVSILMPPNNTVSIFYTFIINKDFIGLQSGTITASGITFFADLV